MNSTLPTKIPPAALAALGVFLLLAARLLAAMPPLRYGEFISGVILILWIAAVIESVALAWRRRIADKTILRYVLALAIFLSASFHFYTFHLNILQTLSLAAVALMTAGFIGWQASHPFLAWLDSLLERAEKIPPRLFIGALVVGFVALCVFLSWYCYSFFPVFTDSEAQYVHAKFMAAGHLYGHAPAHPGFFPVPMSIVDNGKWYSQYQPWHIFLLSLGHRFGAPWLINPLEGGVAIAAFYALSRRIQGEGTARIAACLLCLSPFAWFLSSEYMSHPTAMLFSTLFIWGYVETLEAPPSGKRRFAWAAMAGLCLGLVFLTRPLTVVGVGLAFAAYALHLVWREPRRYFAPCAVMAASFSACLAFSAWYNYELTGDALMLPYMQYHGHKLSTQVEFTGWAGIKNIQEEWMRLNSVLFDWPVPCTLFMLTACLLPLRNRYLKLLLAMLFCYTAAYYTGHGRSTIWGPRYLYETLPAVILLSAEGIARLPQLLASWRMRLPAPEVMRGFSLALVSALFAWGWICEVPRDVATYSGHYMDSHPGFYFSLLAQAQKPALIFVSNSEGRDALNKYRWVTFTNPPSDDAAVIFAADRGDRDAVLAKDYPNRHVYIERYRKLYPFKPQ